MIGPSPGRRVSFHTLGCRLNQAETALIAEGFRRSGYEVREHGSPVEVAVIHTCSVTDRADASCRHAIRKIRKRSPDAVVCAVGCYAQAEPDAAASVPGVDLVVGNDRKYRLADLVEDLTRGACEGPRIEVERRPGRGAFDVPGAGHYPFTTRANLKIQDGCDFCCAFCILPRIRGRAHSRPFGEVVAEARELARRGHRELVITGVNVGTYGSGGRTVADVARAACGIPGVARVRVSSIEPTTVPGDLVDWMASDERACPHLHLPLQSGDDRVLSRMRRVYTASDYVRFAESALARVPGLALGTDVIVGFPGETDPQFERTLALVERIPFAYLHVFSYSDRPRTVADRLDGKVHARTVKERSERMRALASRKKRAFLASRLGRVDDVLFETVDGDGLRKGLTGSYVRVGVPANACGENDLVAVRLAEDAGGFVRGTIAGSRARAGAAAGGVP